MINRESVFNKYDGRCAYCGHDIIFKNFQVDHKWPKFLAHHQPGLDPDRMDNLMPSCRKCNNHKHAMRLELFRREIGRQVQRLMKNSQFCRALRYKQIKINENPIVFYFEERKK